MAGRDKVYFVSDVHLGLDVKDPADRERRFASFLDSIGSDAKALYLLGDIWDFWYEYRDVVPKGYIKVLSALQRLVEDGVEVFFFQGNHDVWTYHYFEELGMRKLTQPCRVEIGGKVFCLGHGDGLGPAPRGYLLLRSVFHCRALQFMFSLLHPWIAFRLGNGWSRRNRLARRSEYVFRDEDEPIVKFAEGYLEENEVDYFIFGHFHVDVRMKLSGGAELFILKDWLDSSPYLYFDGTDTFGASFQKME